jgi:hypothetical protein
MSSYIYPTVFVRNAANLTQLLPKASKIRYRTENYGGKFLRAFLGALKRRFSGIFSGYTVQTI